MVGRNCFGSSGSHFSSSGLMNCLYASGESSRWATCGAGVCDDDLERVCCCACARTRRAGVGVRASGAVGTLLHRLRIVCELRVGCGSRMVGRCDAFFYEASSHVIRKAVAIAEASSPQRVYRGEVCPRPSPSPRAEMSRPSKLKLGNDEEWFFRV